MIKKYFGKFLKNFNSDNINISVTGRVHCSFLYLFYMLRLYVVII